MPGTCLTGPHSSGMVCDVMLKVRLQRVGRKNDPSFRMVVTESQRGPKTGNYIEMVGSYDPKRKTVAVNSERISYWLSVGAKASDTVHNILIKQKVISGKKINVLPKKTPIIKEKKEEEQTVKAKTAEAPQKEEAEEKQGEKQEEVQEEVQEKAIAQADAAPTDTPEDVPSTREQQEQQEQTEQVETQVEEETPTSAVEGKMEDTAEESKEQETQEETKETAEKQSEKEEQTSEVSAIKDKGAG